MELFTTLCGFEEQTSTPFYSELFFPCWSSLWYKFRLLGQKHTNVLMSLLCEISEWVRQHTEVMCWSCCSDVPCCQKLNKTQIGGRQRHPHSHFLFTFTECLTWLLLKTLSACSDDSYAMFSSKMILQIQQVKKTCKLYRFKIYKIIITKCSSLEKIGSVAYKTHQFTPIKNIKGIWMWNTNRALQKQHRHQALLH